MKNLKFLNSLVLQILFLLGLTVFARTTEPIDIWKENDEPQTDQKIIKENVLEDNNNLILKKLEKKEIIVSEEENNIKIQNVYGLFDPEDNDLDLNMWVDVDGKKLTELMIRLKNKNLSKDFEDLMIKVVLTNSYLPQKNINPEDFLKYKLEWLLDRKKINYIEEFLEANPNLENNSNLIRFLIDEYLSNANIKKACQKTKFLNKEKNSKYLDKFKIYCLINNDRKDEAQLIFELLKDRGFKDNFYENKINFLLGYTDKTDQKILDNDLFNFYLCHITSDNFVYEPNEKTNKYVWKYLSSSNLIKINDIEDEETIKTYEKAAAENSFESEEIFNIYKQILFNVNQLINATESYKTLPGYKARALIYQSILLSDNIERKLYLTFLLKELFSKEKLSNVYSKELTNILRNIDPEKIPENYQEIVENNIKQNYQASRKVKFNNDVLHRSKVIRHFLDDNEEITGKTEKDFKSVYKKIKKNKKYFISIKDIIVLDSLAFDGMKLPQDLNYNDLLSELNVPKNLQELVSQNQLGLTMLKIIEIIGEDNIDDLDPETIYFLNSILNELNLKKIRNGILSEALPVKV